RVAVTLNPPSQTEAMEQPSLNRLEFLLPLLALAALADVQTHRVWCLAMNLVQAFGQSVSKSPDKIELYWGDRKFSYHRLWDDSMSVCRKLGEGFCLPAGDRVGLWLKNCPEFVP